MATSLGTSLGRRLGTSLSNTLTPFEEVLALAATRPVFTADYYILDPLSGKVYAFVDWNDPTHWLVQADSSKQVAAPLPHADYGGKLCVTFTGAEWYVSNRAAAQWTYWSNGVSVGGFAIATATGPVGSGLRLASTRNNGRGNVIAINSPTTHFVLINDGAGNPVIASAGALAFSVPRMWTFRYTEGVPSPEWRIKVTGASEATGDSSLPPSASAPEGPLTFGANVGGSLPFIGRACFLAPTNDLGAVGTAKMQAALTAIYGVAA